MACACFRTVGTVEFGGSICCLSLTIKLIWAIFGTQAFGLLGSRPPPLLSKTLGWTEAVGAEQL